jgi:hypothetical protein
MSNLKSSFQILTRKSQKNLHGNIHNCNPTKLSLVNLNNDIRVTRVLHWNGVGLAKTKRKAIDPGGIDKYVVVPKICTTVSFCIHDEGGGAED